MRLLSQLLGLTEVEARKLIEQSNLQPFIIARNGTSVPKPEPTTPRHVLLALEGDTVIEARLN